ncbi:MAG: carbohydrate binding domain-containing protein [Candidatus Cloacimonadia bacterium]
MKKTLTALIVGLFVLGFSSLALGQNLVSNPGFENWTAGMPDDWGLSGGSITVEQEATIIHGGSYSAKVTWTTTNTRHLEQVVPVSPNTDYTFSAWIYDNDPDGQSRLTLRWEEEGGTYISNDYSGYTSDTEWQNLTVSATAPANAGQARLRISVYDMSGWDGDATIYADDVEFTGPGGTPIMTKAYSISETELDVFYNQDMALVNVSDYTLTGTETITFSEATIDGDNPKLVHLTGASADMVGDLTLDNIYDAENDTDFDFYAGITPIALTNTLNPDGHIDNAHLATFQGIVSANDAYNNVWVSDNPGAYNGVMVFDYDFDALVAVGEEILFTAIRDEYYNLTELTGPQLIAIVSTGNSPYGPTVISGSDINENIPANTNPAEQWEGQLVTINNVLVASLGGKDDLYVGSDDGWETTFRIGDNVDYQYTDTGALLEDAVASGEPISITGVVDFSYGRYRINPRFAGDLEEFSVTPNQASTIITLSQNNPNPVTNSTVIKFNLASLPNTKDATLEIYNILGQMVRKFALDDLQGEIHWDRTDNHGNKVENGIYMYRLSAGKDSFVKKMVVLD